MSRIKPFILAISTLSGTIIGVGIFSLPYITSKVGFWTISVYFLLLGTLVTLIHLFFGKLVLETPDFKRLPGFAKIYLGKHGEIIAYFSTILGLFGANLAYLIVGGEFLANLFSPFFGGSSLIYTLLYFFSGAVLIYFGIRAISQIEFWGLVLFFLILSVIFFQGQPFLKIENLFPKTGFSNLFLPYGPILFSLWGASLIPEIEEMLGENKKLLWKIIFLATLIPILIYLFFIFLILGITGKHTTESALVGLQNFLGPGTLRLAFLFGIVTTFTSFIALGLTLKNMFFYDLKIKKNMAWLITVSVPLTLFLIGVKSFIGVISFVGAIMLGIDGILILLMYQKISRQRILVYPLILIFLGGIIYELIYFIK